ncbi:MAG: precorrin-2 C(20)-methyltransferase, partial [Treponemataceae bacterium]
EVYNQLAENILADVKIKNNNVGFITIGDPMIYSSAIYILKRLSGKIKLGVVPAVSSFCAVAAKSNFPLCFEDKTLTVIPATVGVEKIKNFLQFCDTLVILKAYKNFNAIVKLITESGYENNAIAVSNLGLPTEKVFPDFKSFAEIPPQYLTTIIVNKNWSLL